MNKKNFCFKNQEYSIITGTRNYLEYYELYRNTVRTRKRIVKGFQVSNDVDELNLIAIKYFAHKMDIKIQTIVFCPLQNYINDNAYRYKEKTVSSFTSIAKKFGAWYKISNVNPKKITPQHAQQFITWCLIGGTSNNTIYNYIKVLTTIYNGLNAMAITNVNPFATIKKVKRAPVSLPAFNALHIKNITTHCATENPQLLLAIKLLYSCFIQPNEQRQLQIYDVNLDENFIEINGKISKNGKTQKVAIPPYLLKDLQNIKNYPGYYYLFSLTGAPGVEMCGRDTISKQHKKVLQKLRINGRYAFYSWKHTGVINAVKNGVNIKDLQLQLRHHSLDMVNEYLKQLGVMDSTDLLNKLPPL